MADEAADASRVYPVQIVEADGYRTAHIDGAVISLTHHNLFHLVVYDEFPSLQTESEMTFSPDGMMSERKGTPVTGHIHRELQFGMLMTPQAAFGLMKILEYKFRQMGFDTTTDAVTVRDVEVSDAGPS